MDERRHGHVHLDATRQDMKRTVLFATFSSDCCGCSFPFSAGSSERGLPGLSSATFPFSSGDLLRSFISSSTGVFFLGGDESRELGLPPRAGLLSRLPSGLRSRDLSPSFLHHHMLMMNVSCGLVCMLSQNPGRHRCYMVECGTQETASTMHIPSDGLTLYYQQE